MQDLLRRQRVHPRRAILRPSSCDPHITCPHWQLTAPRAFTSEGDLSAWWLFQCLGKVGPQRIQSGRSGQKCTLDPLMYESSREPGGRKVRTKTGRKEWKRQSRRPLLSWPSPSHAAQKWLIHCPSAALGLPGGRCHISLQRGRTSQGAPVKQNTGFLLHSLWAGTEQAGIAFSPWLFPARTSVLGQIAPRSQLILNM